MSAGDDARDKDDHHEESEKANGGGIVGQLSRAAETGKQPGLDDFGLPIKPRLQQPRAVLGDEDAAGDEDTFHDAEDGNNTGESTVNQKPEALGGALVAPIAEYDSKEKGPNLSTNTSSPRFPIPAAERDERVNGHSRPINLPNDNIPPAESNSKVTAGSMEPSGGPKVDRLSTGSGISPVMAGNTVSPKKGGRRTAPAVSEWSHQRLVSKDDTQDEAEADVEDWQAMTALSEYDIYDDDGKLVARGAPAVDDEEAAYGGHGGAGKGYTRVQLEEDAQSATSMDEDTSYLFKEKQGTDLVDDEEQRDPLSQMEATKDLLTEGQRIAYVGVTRLAMYKILQELEDIDPTRATKKDLLTATESMRKWGQQMMVRLYGHMDISSDEQIMIESLAEHGVQTDHLSAPLREAARVKNPMAESLASPRKAQSLKSPSLGGPDASLEASKSSTSLGSVKSPQAEAPPPYAEKEMDDLPQVRTPSQLPTDDKIDLDLRWTVLCDLFLVLLSDSTYDARSRLLLERVAEAMDISWVQVCRFEKRVIDALEMQEEKDQENWNEEGHMENRRKLGLKRKYVVMGIATAGGALVIGLSAGLLAPVIGAGLAAGFTTIGVTGTGAFLGGIGGAALITSAAVATGGTIAVRASHRRTGAVKTFEYRPLHNNKRLNLILSVSGWMNGKVDDVRLPYSTVDPIMGDIYSLLWEPEMLQSMGDTINILATEALTQTIQQVLGSTILVALMASIQLPVVLTKLSYLIDNPWTVSLDRANLAGLILADSLIDRHLGNRPITLVGFSLGSRVIFACLKELANRNAYGLIQNAYLFGSPIVAKKDDYLRARTVVSGRFVNGYASNDWILGYLFRATSGGIMRIAGLAPVEEIPGLENLDVTQIVNGHMAYRAAMPRLLREVGWEVDSDEFTEIEDPDPENHQKRQRELIREIDEARKDAEAKPSKKRFGFFRRGKLAEKKGWETYEKDEKLAAESRDSSDTSWNGNVLFDIEAIKAELESEMIEVKQLESTLPPMRLDLNGTGPSTSSVPTDPRSALRQTQSSDASLGTQSNLEGLVSPSSSNGARSSSRQDVGFNGMYAIRDRSPSAKPEHVNVQMTFDHSFDEPRELESTAPPLTISSFLPKDVTPNRPGFKSSATMPTGTITTLPTSPGLSNLEHNAWVDDEDALRKEGEVKMTFE